MLWNKQDPPVSDEALAKIGYATINTPEGLQLCRKHSPLTQAFGNFWKVKWAQTPLGPALICGEITLGYPDGAGGIPYAMQQPQEVAACKFCGSDRCGVDISIRDAAQRYVECPKCGARGPRGATAMEAIRLWGTATVTHRAATRRFSGLPQPQTMRTCEPPCHLNLRKCEEENPCITCTGAERCNPQRMADYLASVTVNPCEVCRGAGRCTSPGIQGCTLKKAYERNKRQGRVPLTRT